jgi:hypothetical protein
MAERLLESEEAPEGFCGIKSDLEFRAEGRRNMGVGILELGFRAEGVMGIQLRTIRE